MMTSVSKQAANENLPAHFAVYDRHNPSSLFEEHHAFIEGIEKVFDQADCDKIAKIENFVLNTKTGSLNLGGIPGIRPNGIQETAYISRFSEEPYKILMEKFLSASTSSREERLKAFMPPAKIMTPGGLVFYPIVYHGDILRWRSILEESARACNARIGRFELDAFVVQDGSKYKIPELLIELLWTRDIPKNW